LLWIKYIIKESKRQAENKNYPQIEEVHILANEDIKKNINDAGVFFYEIAERLGMNDGNFSRLLRNEFSEARKDEVYAIIESVVESRKQDIGNPTTREISTRGEPK
jgi:hypothetical protein